MVNSFPFGSEVDVVINTSEKSFNNFIKEPDVEYSDVDTDLEVKDRKYIHQYIDNGTWTKYPSQMLMIW